MNRLILSDSLDRLMQPERLAPYLLVPAVIAALLAVEVFLPSVMPAGPSAAGGLTAALVNAAFAVSLISAGVGAWFMSATWGSAWFYSMLHLDMRRSDGYWQVVLAHMTITIFILALTCAAVAAAMPFDAGALAAASGVCLAAALWSVGIAALAARLTAPAPALLLSCALVATAFLGPRGVLPGDLPDPCTVIPDFGGVAAEGASGAHALRAVLVAVAGAAAALAAGRLLFGLGLGRPARH